MNIVNKLTISHIKGNLKRSILTLMGIIVSVSMVTAVFTSALSFMDFLKNITIEYDGNWYSYFTDCNVDDFNKIKAQDNVEYAALVNGELIADSDKTEDLGKNETTISAVNGDYYKIYNINPSEGEYPKTENEILVSKAYIDKNNLNWKVGDTVTVAVSSGVTEGSPSKDVTYKISGITTAASAQEEASAITTVLNTKTGKGTLYIKNTKLGNGIWDDMKQNATVLGKDAVDDYNNELFMYSLIIRDNDVLPVLGGFVAIMLVIIVIASVFMIYDSFAVSYQQRARYLGMLASVGATKRQKRHSIYFEGFILGIIGIPIGILAGVGGIAVTFKAISPILSSTMAVPVSNVLKVTFNPLIVLFSVLLSGITIFISAYIPARKASKTTAIDAIRQNNTVKVKKAKKLKASRLSTKMFGYEGALATKNFKRNSKRSRTIVLALSMSIVLFLTVTSFSNMFSGLINSNYGVSSGDIICTVYNREGHDFQKDASEVEKKIQSIQSVDSYKKTSSTYVDTANATSFLSKDALKIKDKISTASMLVYALPDKTYNEYAASIGVSSETNKDKTGVNGIINDKITVANVNGKKRVTLRAFDQNTVGKTLDTSYEYFSDTDSSNIKAKLNVMAVTDAIPTGMNEMLSDMGITIIIPESEMIKMVAAEDVSITFTINAKEHEKAYNELDEFMSDKDFTQSTYDETAQLQAMNAINTIAKVFGYGFITLITLISIMNIVNTIATAMEERRREFAMIKSVGLTPKSFKKMIYLESIKYGVHAILWGIPISIAVDYLMYSTLSRQFESTYVFHWQYYIIAVVAVFAIIALALIYSFNKIKKDNIIETLKRDDI